MLTEKVVMCNKERCSRISFIVLNIFFFAFGVALFTGSCIVRYDQSMADSYLGYSSFQRALESANLGVHTPSSLNIGETLDVVCIVFIVIGVLFLLLGIMGIIGAFVRLKSPLITYAVVLLVLVVLELICVVLVTALREKLEGWIKDALKDSIRNNYSGITGNDTDTLRWNFIMHSFQCCGVDRYTDFRTLRPVKLNIEIEVGVIVTEKQIPYACCKVKNDIDCVLSPNSTTAFLEKLVLLVLAFIICCTLRKKDKEMDPVETYQLPQVHSELRNQELFNPSDVFMNPVYNGPTFHDDSVEIYPPRQSRELFNSDNEPKLPATVVYVSRTHTPVHSVRTNLF